MLNSGYAIVPKDSNESLRVLMIGRISTEHQSLENADSFQFLSSRLPKMVMFSEKLWIAKEPAEVSTT
jgi:hypothetical protein